MSSWAEHVKLMEDINAFGIMEDPSGDIEGAMSIVTELMDTRISNWDREVAVENLRGAANQAKMMVLRALSIEFTRFRDELEGIIFLNHKHEEDIEADIELITNTMEEETNG